MKLKTHLGGQWMRIIKLIRWVAMTMGGFQGDLRSVADKQPKLQTMNATMVPKYFVATPGQPVIYISAFIQRETAMKGRRN